MRVVLDTNVLVSSVLSPFGTAAHVVDMWMRGKFVLLSHPLQLNELREVSRRTKLRPSIRPSQAGRLVNRIVANASMPDQLPPVDRSPDPADDFLLALCEAGRADWLVTGDKRDLLFLTKHKNTRIVSLTAFAAMIAH